MKRTIIVLVCCTFLFSLSAFGLWFSSLDYGRAKEEYHGLGRYVEFVPTVTEGSLKSEDIGEFRIDWGELRKLNPDIVGWIYAPGTVINYPVVQGRDNTTYLTRSYLGEKNICGAIFLDSRCYRDLSDRNLIVYGHNMRDGSMFATLNDYLKSEAFYSEHSTVWLCTPKWQRKYRVISVHETLDASESYTYQFEDGAYEHHVADEIEQSVYPGGSYDVSLPMLTLSTCNGRGEKDRTVLVAQPVYEVLMNE